MGSSADSRDSMEVLERARQQRAAAESENVTPRAETPADMATSSVNLRPYGPIGEHFECNGDITPFDQEGDLVRQNWQ